MRTENTYILVQNTFGFIRIIFVSHCCPKIVVSKKLYPLCSQTRKQAGAEFNQAQQLGFQIWGLLGFCCQRPA